MGLALGQALLPELFDPERSLLFRQQESATARRYRQLADAESIERGERVTALELVEKEIERYQRLIQTSREHDELTRELNMLRRARGELQPRPHTEQQLILRDALRTYQDVPISGAGRDYREFALSNDRALRIRVLHPDPPEQSTGADVIYEHYWDKKGLVRLAAIQYKVWDGEVLYQTERMARQLARFREVFCGNGLCRPSEQSQGKDAYRLPYCSGFLRPTDRLQASDSRFISTGYHIPVCMVARFWERTRQGGQKLTSKSFRSEAVTHRIFEELFNTNMLGSKWLTYEELEELYHQHKILEPDEHVIIHAQEFGT